MINAFDMDASILGTVIGIAIGLPIAFLFCILGVILGVALADWGRAARLKEMQAEVDAIWALAEAEGIVEPELLKSASA